MTAPEDPATAVTASSRTKGRQIAFTVSTLLFAAGAAGGLFGIGIVIGWSDTDEGGIHRVHDIGFGVLYGVLLTVAFVAMAGRPGSKTAAFFQVVVTALAALIAGLVTADQSYLMLALVVFVAAAILLALHPARAELFHPAPRPSPVIATFVLAASVPFVWFGLTMANLQREGAPADPHVSMDHWANMAAMAFGLVLAGLLASSGIRGWRLTAWCAGLGAAAYGLASIVFQRFPGTSVPYPGSEGVGWGLVAVIGGLAFIALSEWEARRSRAASITRLGPGR